MAEGRAMPLVRNPLALFWLAVRRLWRNWRFVGILLLCWLASAAIYWLVLDPLVYAPMRQQWQAELGAGLPETEPGIGCGVPFVVPVPVHFGAHNVDPGAEEGEAVGN